jgi:nitroimidazol reductase NimA-like FMN-containing flavoprotein (pyridoxamine 5'-phosphate oxidase superfamily)
MMRRQEREMNSSDAARLLEEGQLGVLCTVGADGEPYGVPLNYCYIREDNAVFFHCANVGRKLDNIKSNARVSFTVTGHSLIIPEKLTTYYESVIAVGRASFVQGDEEKKLRLNQLCCHLTPGIEWQGDSGCRHLSATAIVRIDLDSISGKKNGDT